MQRNPRAVETAEGERKSLRTRDSSGAQEARYLKRRQKVKRECRDVARVKPRDGQGAVQAGENSEAELNLTMGTSSKETMSQGPGRSEVAKRNERKRPRGGLKTINKGTHANPGRNPTRDGEQRGRQKVPEMATDRM